MDEWKEQRLSGYEEFILDSKHRGWKFLQIEDNMILIFNLGACDVYLIDLRKGKIWKHPKQFSWIICDKHATIDFCYDAKHNEIHFIGIDEHKVAALMDILPIEI